jgi:hypothetical protein
LALLFRRDGLRGPFSADTAASDETGSAAAASVTGSGGDGSGDGAGIGGAGVTGGGAGIGAGADTGGAWGGELEVEGAAVDAFAELWEAAWGGGSDGIGTNSPGRQVWGCRRTVGSFRKRSA